MTSFRIALLISLLTLGFGAAAVAEDLSDPAVCLDCHADADRTLLTDNEVPQVHNPEGGFFVEDHSGFACVDCHTYIKDLEHDGYAPGQKVDCLECHDEVPSK